MAARDLEDILELTDELFRETYEELRRLADHYLRGERRDHTLQATALVHEAYLRLSASRADCADRKQLIGFTARVMRQVLVDWARGRGYAKRGGGRRRVTLDEKRLLALPEPPEILDLNAALSRLATYDERKARIVELRAFGGLTLEEVAEYLDVSVPTVSREWRSARSWIAKMLSESAGTAAPSPAGVAAR